MACLELKLRMITPRILTLNLAKVKRLSFYHTIDLQNLRNSKFNEPISEPIFDQKINLNARLINPETQGYK